MHDSKNMLNKIKDQPKLVRALKIGHLNKKSVYIASIHKRVFVVQTAKNIIPRWDIYAKCVFIDTGLLVF